ncbi:MAG: hypothetical protein Q9195_004045 [Heterodermia aff. obscurata]
MDVPPPPYSPIDLHAAPNSSSRDVNPSPGISTRLRGGYIRRDEVSQAPRHQSAAQYFDERPCMFQNPSFVLKYPLTIASGATGTDISFPQPERDYRARDVTTVDWHTFTSYLIPSESPDSHSGRDTPSHGAHDNPQRQSSIRGVINEWNEGFFNPRGVLIHYEPNVASATSSRSAASEIPVTLNSSGSQLPALDPRARASSAGFAQPHSCGHFHDWEPRDQQNSHHRSSRSKQQSRHRASSSSSSSSSSSLSSESSIDSISSKDLNGLDHTQVQRAMANFRVTAPTTSLSSAVGQLRTQLRAQRHAAGISNQCINMANQAQLRAESRRLQAQIKDEVRAMKGTRKEQRRAWRQTKKEARRERRGLQRELKRERRDLKRETKAAYRDAKRQAKAEKRARKSGFGLRNDGTGGSRGVDDVTREMQQMGIGRTQEELYRGQETGLIGNSQSSRRNSEKA